MSKISLKPNASGTGVFSLEAPATNTDRTLNLPDETGDLVTTATDLEPQVKDSLNATGSAPVYACRAWVNFNGDGTVSIRGSGNVSSVTDNGGSYTINFATPMPDINYCVAGQGDNIGSVGNTFYVSNSGVTTSSVQFKVADATNTDQAPQFGYCSIFR